MKKIEKGTHGGVFDWLLESDNHSCHDYGNSAMIRVLVQQHNEMVDKIETIYQKGFEHGYTNGMEDAKKMVMGKDLVQ